jgi:hypothetical protein
MCLDFGRQMYAIKWIRLLALGIEEEKEKWGEMRG